MSDDKNSAAIKQINDDFAASVTEKLRGRAVTEICPLCRNINWYLMDRIEPTNTLHFFENQTAAIYTLACTNCGFVRQHVQAIVDGKITGKTSHDPE